MLNLDSSVKNQSLDGIDATMLFKDDKYIIIKTDEISKFEKEGWKKDYLPEDYDTYKKRRARKKIGQNQDDVEDDDSDHKESGHVITEEEIKDILGA